MNTHEYIELLFQDKLVIEHAYDLQKCLGYANDVYDKYRRQVQQVTHLPTVGLTTEQKTRALVYVLRCVHLTPANELIHVGSVSSGTP
jgi:hypothetical protein